VYVGRVRMGRTWKVCLACPVAEALETVPEATSRRNSASSAATCDEMRENEVGLEVRGDEGD
jgi:hypothetical protein